MKRVLMAVLMLAVCAVSASAQTTARDNKVFTGQVEVQAQPVYVPTFAATPAAGTNDLKPGKFNAVPTAAANAAACLPSVPVAGQVVEGFNTMANAVRVKACGTPGINGGASGTYFPVAAATYFKCVADTATNWNCGSLAVPTPAGP